MTTLGDIIGAKAEEEFSKFDLTEIQEILGVLANAEPIDIVHGERYQRLALRGADIITDYMGKIVKTVGYLESKINSTKNKTSLDYTAPEGRTTAEMKKWAGECSPAVEDLQISLAKAKASKLVLEKKYDLLIKSHHYWKDITTGLRKTVLGYNTNMTDTEQTEKVASGWE